MQRKTEVLLFRWLSPHHFPLLAVVFLTLSCVCAYGISVGTGKVGALFPYISDAGSTPPASCVFGLMLNMASMFGFICIYIRHGDIEQSDFLEDDTILVVNDISMFIGWLSFFGMILVASFQSTEVLIVHMIGAAILFFGGVTYCYLQSYLSYVRNGRSTNSKVIVRLVLSMIGTLSLSFTTVFGFIATYRNKGAMVKDKLHWTAGEPGYYAHLISAFSEWITALSFMCFFLTFYREFKIVESKIDVRRKLNVNLTGQTYEVIT